MLVVFLAGAMAMWFIAHLATTEKAPSVVGGSEASYGSLKQSILKP